jgi:YD repeat-containing protein
LPPTFQLTDKYHVDQLSRLAHLSIPDVGVGAGDRKLSHSLELIGSGILGPFGSAGIFDSFSGGIMNTWDSAVTAWYSVWLGNSRSNFYASASGGPYVEAVPQGETLVNNGDQTYTWTRADGTIYKIQITVFQPNATYTFQSYTRTYDRIGGNLINVTKPTGEVYSISTATNSPQSVSTNFGLQLQYIIGAASTQVVAFNAAVDYCGPTANSCAFSQAWPTASISYPSPAPTGYCPQWDASSYTYGVTDMAGRNTQITTDSLGRPTGVQDADSTTPNLLYTYITTCPSGAGPATGQVTKQRMGNVVSQGAQTTFQFWAFAAPGNPYAYGETYQATDPVGAITQVMSPEGGGYADQLHTPDGTIVTYTGDGADRVSTVTKPEGGVSTYSYDARGNLTLVSETGKPGSGLSRSIQANYDASTCTYRAKCNKPNWVKDANLGQTDFTYDPTTGLMLTKTLPAGDSGVRPQVRYSYAQRYAWFKNSGGAYVQGATPIWVLTQESTCKTGAPGSGGVGCAVAGDEVITSYDYGPNSGPNNLFVRGKVVDAGGLALRSCYAYDNVGNKISETTPLAGLTSCP